MHRHEQCLQHVRSALGGVARELEPAALTLVEAKAMLADVVAVKNLASTVEGQLARLLARPGTPWTPPSGSMRCPG